MTSSGNSSSPSTGEVILTSSHTLFNVSTTNITKLVPTNYLMWSLQVQALFDGYELAVYLDGSITPPPATTTTATTTATNPDFTFWKRQDKLIYIGLIGAMSVSVQPLVSRATTSSEIWQTLASTFAQPSRGHVKQLRDKLKLWTKGSKTIDEYVRGFIIQFDELALLGNPLTLEEQVEAILEGLPEEYMSVVDQIEGRDVPPTIAYVHEKLRNREARVLALAVVTPNDLHISANAVQTRNNNNNNNNNYSARGNNRNQQRFPQQPSYYNNNNNTNKSNQRQPRPYLGRCQICGVQGHSARRCTQLQSLVSGNQQIT